MEAGDFGVWSRHGYSYAPNGFSLEVASQVVVIWAAPTFIQLLKLAINLTSFRVIAKVGSQPPSVAAKKEGKVFTVG